MSEPAAQTTAASELLDRDGNPLPPLPDTATPEEKDAYWLAHVYQGDRLPQLTLRAVLMGGILGMLMAASNLYTVLKIGWAFGVAITACVMSFVIWNAIRALSMGSLSRMSILENNCMQSTASAAGYSTGSTLATMFGSLLLLAAVPEGKTSADVTSWGIQPVWLVAAFTLCTGLLGVLMAIPLKRQMINYEGLRFPSGVAAAATLRSLHSASKDALARAYVLILGIAVGIAVGILNTGQGTLAILDSFNERFQKVFRFALRIPESLPHTGFFQIHGKQLQAFQFDLSVLLIAAGVITRLRVCISMFAGALLLYCFVGPSLIDADVHAPGSGWRQESQGAWVRNEQGEYVRDPSVTWVFDARTRDPAYLTNIPVNVKPPDLNSTVVAENPAAFQNPPDAPEGFVSAAFGGAMFRLPTWALWGGTSVMVLASLASLALQWRTVVRAFAGVSRTPGAGATQAAGIEVPTAWMIVGLVPVSLALLVIQIVGFNISWWAGLIAVSLSFILAMVACRATGETDTTPIGAMGKVMQLLFAVLHPGQIVPNLASAGVAANSASSSSDLLTDLKSGYLLGANPRKQFLAQFIGVFFGTLAVVPIWFLMVPNKAAMEALPAPATRQWEAVARILTRGIDQLPHSAQVAILVGAAIGILLPVLEKLLPRHRKYIPSAMGLGLSWVIPFSSALGFFIGAVLGWLWELAHRKSADKYSVGLASGLIAGEGLIKAIIAMTATAIGLLKG
jgi:uncharacterized oligopeptide transporter (OPT) family protein